MKRKQWMIFRISLSLLLVLTFLLFPVRGIAETQTEEEIEAFFNSLYAKSAALIDADTGRVLLSKDGDTLMPMASTTKIMTCVIAIENADLNDVYEASSYAASMPKVHMGVTAGEKYRLEDLLYALMLESFNDAAVIIAEGVAGSVDEFASLMNEKAVEIGALNTHFVTPNGLDADGHQTTAEDMAKIMAYCIRNEEFLRITRTESHTFTDIDGKRSFSVYNRNAFLSMMEGALSGKTGFTGKAGYCYVGAYEKDGKTFTVALLACGWPPNKTYKWQDTRKLYEYGAEHYKTEVVLDSDLELPNAQVLEGINGSVALYYEDSLEILMSERDKAQVRYQLDLALEAPVYAGQQVGTIDLYINDELFRQTPVYTAQEDRRIDYWYCLGRILSEAIL